VWNKDAFALDIGSDGEEPCLWGELRFGDSIDDEWFTVYLLRRLTALFPDLVVRAVDGDGELLLIEAAHALPAWVTPDNADNRVFLHQGAVHLVDPALAPADPLALCDGVYRAYA
jgi:hypothetical protein